MKNSSSLQHLQYQYYLCSIKLHNGLWNTFSGGSSLANDVLQGATGVDILFKQWMRNDHESNRSHWKRTVSRYTFFASCQLA